MKKTGQSPVIEQSFLRRVFVVMSWTLLAQLISVLSMLVLPRLIQPEQFGIFATFSGFSVMFGIVAAGRYEFAIGLPEHEKDASVIFGLCMISAIVFALVCAVIIKLIPIDHLGSAKLSQMEQWWIWTVLAGALISIYNSSSYLALRGAHFNRLGQSKAVMAFVTSIGQIGSAWFISQEEAALIIPFILAQLVGVLTLQRGAKFKFRFFDKGALLNFAHRYRRFPIMVAPASLMDGISVLLPILAITALYSPAQAGAYALADRALKIPVTLIGSSVLQVFYGRAAAIRGNPIEAKRLLWRTWRTLALLALLPCLFLVLWGDVLFAFLFGVQWSEAGTFARYLAVGLLFYFVSYPTSNILVVNERTNSFMLWQLVQLVITVVALGLSAWPIARSLEFTVTMVVVAQISVSLFSMLLQWRAVSSGNTMDGCSGK
jgi:O-antigen/teichoic acid export membrane protein